MKRGSVRASLRTAERLLRRAFVDFPPRPARFPISDPGKQLRIGAGEMLGSFDAWEDLVRLNLEEDPLGTAVHELLHANAYGDDWLPEDTGTDTILSFRGFELQLFSADRRRVLDIRHRAINEGVTELLTRHAYPAAESAYEELLPTARELAQRIGLDVLARLYFRAGYPGLEAVLGDEAITPLSAAADAALDRIMDRSG
jgi:hypothetical protein